MKREKKKRVTIPIALTSNAVDWIIERFPLLVATDFTGYIVPVSNKYKVSMAVTLRGYIIFFSTNEKKPGIKERQLNKIIKSMLRKNILINANSYVFPEYEKAYNLPYDKNNTIFIPEPLFYSGIN